MSYTHDIGMPFNKMIIACAAKHVPPRKDVRMMSMYEAIHTKGLPDAIWRNDHVVFKAVRCEEHDRLELVPSNNYNYDLWLWYAEGLHPRFSIAGALVSAEQRYGEIRTMVQFANWNQKRESTTAIREALKTAKTPEALLKAIHVHLNRTLVWRGRQYRVGQTFYAKFKTRGFTVEDFFAEQSQEMRRLILSRGGLSIGDIRSKMKKLAKDDEGTIYEYKDARYLYVKCPSTGQEYLLSIPQDIDKPSEARRWTFDLPAGAKFVAEA